MKRIAPLLLLLCATSAAAQVYRWVDAKGTVHYSNAAPPKDAKATVVDVDARAGPPSAESQECYSVRRDDRGRIHHRRRSARHAGARGLGRRQKLHLFPDAGRSHFTTTVVVGAGRIRAIERVRKF
jgi:hypothetical protein